MGRIVAVTGGISVGKTTLGRKLSTSIENALFLEETPEKNPFIGDFYSDKRKWAFHSRIGMLALFRERSLLFNTEKICILDRTIHELMVFAKLQLQSGTMSKREFDLYATVFDAFCEAAPRPDKIIRVVCDGDVALKRLQQRGREFESSISIDYLSSVEAAYDEWFATQDVCNNIIEIDTTDDYSVEDVVKLIDF